MYHIRQSYHHLRWRWQLASASVRQHLEHIAFQLSLVLRTGNISLTARLRTYQPLKAVFVAVHLASQFIIKYVFTPWISFTRILPHPNRLLVTAKWSIVAIVLLLIVLVLEPYVLSYWIWPEYTYRHERFSGTALTDTNGTFLGYIPGHLDPLADYSMGHQLPADHKAIPVTTVPPVWRSVLYALEDRHHDTWRSIHGIDVIAIFRAATYDLFLGDSISGASTLNMMLARSMRHEAPNRNQSVFEQIKRKLIQFRDGPVLHHNLSTSEVDHWLAMHLPLIQGTGKSGLGGSIYGIETAGQILFCHGAAELTPGEQAMLAAAVKQPILIASQPNPVTQERINAIWYKHKKRARYGLQHSGLATALIKQALREIDELPPPKPCVPTELAKVLPDDPKQRFRVLADPAYRARYVLGYGGLMELIGELQEAYGRYWRKVTSKVALGVNGAINAQFQNDIKKRLPKIEQTLTGNLLQSIAPQRNNSGKMDAIVLIAVADAQGNIVRFFSNRLDSVYNGSQHLRGRDGHYQQYKETRRIASLGKIPLALLLARRGDDWDRWVYCNKTLPPITNPNGNTGVARCSQSGAYYKPVEVFGASLNLPLLHTARTLSESDLLVLIDQFGLNYDPAMGSPSLALTLGRVTANPHTVHQMMQNIYGALQNRSISDSSPHFITVYNLRAGQQPTRKVVAVSKPDLSSYIGSEKARTFLWQVLGAPLQKRYDGTLSTLEPSYHGNVLRIAKTGTSTSSDGRVLDRWALGGFNKDNQSYTFIILVGSGDGRQPLGSRLSGNKLLAPLITVILKSF